MQITKFAVLQWPYRRPAHSQGPALRRCCLEPRERLHGASAKDNFSPERMLDAPHDGQILVLCGAGPLIALGLVQAVITRYD